VSFNRGCGRRTQVPNRAYKSGRRQAATAPKKKDTIVEKTLGEISHILVNSGSLLRSQS
jgi:hypothetical protein